MTTRSSIPLSLCIVVSLGIHAAIIVPTIGTAGLTSDEFLAPISPEEIAAARQDEQTPEPPPELPNPLVRRPTEVEQVQLGIDNGADQPLTTWIGYEEYQEHLARLSEVEQAAMRLTDAGGGEPAAASNGALSQASPHAPPPAPAQPPSAVTEVDRSAEAGQLASAKPAAPTPPAPPNAPPSPTRATESAPATPAIAIAHAPAPTPETRPAEAPTTPTPTVPAPAPSLALPKSADPPTTPDGAPMPPEPAPGEASKPDPIVRPADGAGESEKPIEKEVPSDAPRPELPEPPEEEQPPTPESGSATAPAMAPVKPVTAPPTPEPQEMPLPAPEDLETAPPHPNPERTAPPSPPATPEASPDTGTESGAPTKPGATPGPPASGEVTDREADPTSTIDVPRERWNNGRPLAAKGLKIVTRRPELLPEYIAVQGGPGRNPVFEIYFDGRGLVRKVQMIESSGFRELDDRLRDSLFKWRASGQQLKSVKPGEYLKFSMRMLVR